MSDTMLKSALAYAERFRWAVIPLKPRGKKPLTSHGVHDATIDAGVIKGWWARWPDANIAIACGPSNLVVIDLDDDEDGIETWSDLINEHDFDDNTVISLTGGGGMHLVFASPAGVDIRNSAGKLGPGVDVRGNGGYIVAPPSVHPNGRPYAWEVTHHPDDRPPAALPTPLLELLTNSDQATPRNAALLPERIPEGQRNETLTSLAGSMRRRGASEDAILAALQTENQERCEPPLPEKEVQRIARSVAQYPPAGQKAAMISTSPDSGPEVHRTDWGNAIRLVARHGRDLRFCHPWGKWLVWNGQHWQLDDTAEVVRRAKETVRSIYAEAATIVDGNERKALAKHAMRSEAEARIRAMVNLAASEPGIPIRPENLDANPWLLTVLNGTLNLKTGELSPHKRGNLITKLIPTKYDPDTTCPTWSAFLDRIMAGNEGMITFLQRAVGYSLTGDVSERILFLMYGCGSNGKTTFLETIRAMLGDYALKTPTETLMVKRAGGIPNDVARLMGARFVSASESEQGQRLAEALIKDLTGGDTVSARFMRAEWFDFTPECKIWLATNHKPVVRGTDKAIWDRIKLIPFTVIIPEPEKDKHLVEKLKIELSGILAWAVRGCLKWQQDGLSIPDEVRSATESYRGEMDVLAGFFADCCALTPTAQGRAGELYDAYCDWCKANGERPISNRRFGEGLIERGFDRYASGGRRYYIGIGLTVEDEEEMPLL